jgi:ribose transport system substrate-binding protein
MKATKFALVGLAAASIIALSACSSGASPTDGASGDHVIKIGYFAPGSNNSYMGANITAAESTAKGLGVQLETVVANWDPAEQTNQFETALARDTYNAWIVAAVAPDQACDSVKQAIAQGIMVLVVNQGLCGDDTYTDGTVGFVGGQTLDTYTGWFQQMVDDNPDGGEFALMTGPNLNYNTNNALAAEKSVIEGSAFDVVSNQQTDYTTTTAFDVASATLQANPNLKVYATNYSEMTNGVVQAIDAAGLTGKVKVYDFGGSEWAAQAVEAGTIELTLPMLPTTELAMSVDEIVKAWNGEKIPQVFQLKDSLKFDGAPYVRKANVAQFTPEYK